MPEMFTDRILDMIQEGFPFEPMLNFLDNLSQNPSDVQALRNLGLEYIRTNNPQRAIGVLHKASELGPNDPENHNLLGQAYIKAGLYKDAITSMQRAVSLRPDMILYHYNLGEAYRHAEMAPQAMSEYKKAADGEAKTPDEKFNKGRVYYRLGLYEDAVKMFRVSLWGMHDAVSRAHAYLALGQTYEVLQNDWQARQSYEQYLITIPNGPVASQVRSRLASIEKTEPKFRPPWQHDPIFKVPNGEHDLNWPPASAADY